MKRLVILTAAIAGGAIAARRLVTPERRERISELPTAMRGRMMERMTRMMEEMPEDAPPKVLMTSLRRIQEQNEEILSLMREQNALLRERPATKQSSTAA